MLEGNENFFSILGPKLSLAQQQGIWPDIFKIEIVTPVKKVPKPIDMDDLRNISGLINLNKDMEKMVHG